MQQLASLKLWRCKLPKFSNQIVWEEKEYLRLGGISYGSKATLIQIPHRPDEKKEIEKYYKYE